MGISSSRSELIEKARQDRARRAEQRQQDGAARVIQRCWRSATALWEVASQQLRLVESRLSEMERVEKALRMANRTFIPPASSLGTVLRSAGAVARFYGPSLGLSRAVKAAGQRQSLASVIQRTVAIVLRFGFSLESEDSANLAHDLDGWKLSALTSLIVGTLYFLAPTSTMEDDEDGGSGAAGDRPAAWQGAVASSLDQLVVRLSRPEEWARNMNDTTRDQMVAYAQSVAARVLSSRPVLGWGHWIGVRLSIDAARGIPLSSWFAIRPVSDNSETRDVGVVVVQSILRLVPCLGTKDWIMPRWPTWSSARIGSVLLTWPGLFDDYDHDYERDPRTSDLRTGVRDWLLERVSLESSVTCPRLSCVVHETLLGAPWDRHASAAEGQQGGGGDESGPARAVRCVRAARDGLSLGFPLRNAPWVLVNLATALVRHQSILPDTSDPTVRESWVRTFHALTDAAPVARWAACWESPPPGGDLATATARRTVSTSATASAGAGGDGEDDVAAGAGAPAGGAGSDLDDDMSDEEEEDTGRTLGMLDDPPWRVPRQAVTTAPSSAPHGLGKTPPTLPSVARSPAHEGRRAATTEDSWNAVVMCRGRVASHAAMALFHPTLLRLLLEMAVGDGSESAESEDEARRSPRMAVAIGHLLHRLVRNIAKSTGHARRRRAMQEPASHAAIAAEIQRTDGPGGLARAWRVAAQQAVSLLETRGGALRGPEVEQSVAKRARAPDASTSLAPTIGRTQRRALRVAKLYGGPVARLFHGLQGASRVVSRLWATLRRDERWDALGRNVHRACREDADLCAAVTFVVVLVRHSLLHVDDEEYWTGEGPLSKEMIVSMQQWLRRTLYQLLWCEQSWAGHSAAADSASPHGELSSALAEQGRLLFQHMYERHVRSRQSVFSSEDWLWPELPARELSREVVEGLAEEDEDGGARTRALYVLTKIPQVVRFNRRVRLFNEMLDHDRGGSMREFGRGVLVRIARNALVEDSFAAFRRIEMERGPDALRSPFRILFVNEQGMEEAGIDGGGLIKEWMDLVVKEAFNPDAGFFLATDQNTLYPNPASDLIADNHLEWFYFLGQLLGKAVYEGILVEPRFALFFLQKLLGQPSLLDDLQSLDARMYHSLVQLKRLASSSSTDTTVDPIAELSLTFTTTIQVPGATREVPLLPSGEEKAVTKDNLEQYIMLFAHQKLNRDIASQCEAFLDGFLALVPMHWMRMFSAGELQTVIGGSEKPIDLAELRSVMHYSGGYSESHPTIQRLWEVLDEVSEEDRARFLAFITSCSRTPLLGFSQLDPRIAITRVPLLPGQTRLPTSSTCFNLLKLPEFDSKEELKERLLYAIRSGAGFDLS